jgi:Coenzyme PQQ synthesis protein D (PqqD)
MEDRRFRIDPAKVVHETVDGETILIHLDTGNYYSLTGVGADVWRLAVAGHSAAEIASALAAAYDDGAEVIGAAVGGLVADLEAERLLEPADVVPVPPPVLAPNGAGPFVAPVLERYEDMQEYLLVDPIHEIEAT